MIETILMFFVIIGLIWNTMKRPKNFPPGPTPLPLIGNLLNLDLSDPQKSFEMLGIEYEGVVGLIFPKYKLVIVNGWSSITEAFSNENFQGKPDTCLARDRFNGHNYGILFTEGEQWKSHRRFTLSHFRNLGFGRKSHESIITNELLSLVDELSSFNCSPIVIEEIVGATSVNLVWCLIGGKIYDRKDERLRNLVNHVKEMVQSVKVIGSPAVIYPFIRYLFPEYAGYTGVKRGSTGILQFVKAAIEERRTDFNVGELNDFISIYLNEMENRDGKTEDSFFSIEQLEGVCLDLLAASNETTSSVISFAILFLCLNNSYQKEIYEEILNVIGKDGIPCYEDKNKLVHTEAYLSECFRYRPPIPTASPHKATDDSRLRGYDIPKDTVLIMNLKSIFFDRQYWIDPETFRPERFITEDGKIKRDERLISFGKGKRSCIAEAFGKMSTFLIFVTLVQKFSFKFPEGELPETTDGSYGFTLTPPHFRVIATPR